MIVAEMNMASCPANHALASTAVWSSRSLEVRELSDLHAIILSVCGENG